MMTWKYNYSRFIPQLGASPRELEDAFLEFINARASEGWEYVEGGLQHPGPYGDLAVLFRKQWLVKV